MTTKWNTSRMDNTTETMVQMAWLLSVVNFDLSDDWKLFVLNNRVLI